jgi:hypothetical protein
MRMSSVLVASLVSGLIALGCSGGERKACTPGASSSCACSSGGNGAQICAADGSGYGPCSCPTSVTTTGPSPGSPGSPCGVNGGVRCDSTPGSNKILSCVSGALVVAGACPGVEACTWKAGLGGGTEADAVACGATPYAINGGVCLGVTSMGASGESACSLDLTKVEECVNGVWVDAVHCPPSNCALLPAGFSVCLGTPSTAPAVQCTSGGYSVGDRCSFPAGDVNCSTDLTSILACSSGITVVTQACSGTKKCECIGQSGSSALGCQ